MKPGAAVALHGALDDAASRARARAGMRTFILVYIAQVVSIAGSQLTAFGLGVWVYEKTGSTTDYGWVALATLAPSVLASPFAGALVDRSARFAMLAGHVGAGLCSLALALLVHFDALRLELVLALVALASVCNAVHFPGLSSVIPRLLPSEQFGRANGAVHLGMATGQIAAPALAAALLVADGIWTILVVDAFTFLVASALLLVIRIPPATGGAADGTHSRSILTGASRGWRYIRGHRGFVLLIALLALMNFNLGMAQVLMTPFVLGFADVHVLGRVMSIAGTGMAVGSVFLIVWGGPRQRVNGVLGFALLESVSMLMLGAMSPSAPLVAACAFGVLFALPLLVGCSQVLWQRKVPAEIQGSVFGIRFMVSKGVVPFTFLLAGPLADGVFEPLMSRGGALSTSIGAVLVTGPGCGIALLFVVLRLLSTLGVALAACSPRLRRLDEEIPDGGLAERPGSGELAECPS